MSRRRDTHTRPEAVLGALAPLHTGPRTAGLGFRNAGGTLTLGGMLFVNHATWAHCVDAAASLLGLAPDGLLTPDERAALEGRRPPDGILF
jgi:hypothetical protein